MLTSLPYEIITQLTPHTLYVKGLEICSGPSGKPRQTISFYVLTQITATFPLNKP